MVRIRGIGNFPRKRPEAEISELPKEPGPVKITLHDGSIIGAEVVYCGRDETGQFVWEVTSVIPAHLMRSMSMGTIPARTSVSFPLGVPVEWLTDIEETE